MKFKKKILKNFFVQNFLGALVAFYIFIVKITSKIHHKNIDIPQYFWKENKTFILAFWHGQLMTISFCWKYKKNLNILASTHSDGRFGAIIGKYFNLKNLPITGKGNSVLLRKIFKELKENNYIGMTPDGPRGPKQLVSEGIIRIAKTTNTPIIPCGFWSSKNFNLKSWDSFLITLPFSSCCFYWKKPITIPQNIKEEEIQYYQNLLKKMIDDSINEAKKFT